MAAQDLEAAAQQAIDQGSQSFAAAARLMPKATRRDTVMLYAWCRHADDVIDGQDLGLTPQPSGDASETLADLRAQTRAALHSDDPVQPPFAALRAVARRHDFPEDWPLTLIDGFAMDTEGRVYETIEDTLSYAYHVAGIVGVMMARVMGVQDAALLDRACDLGIALQLTNIARDVLDDQKIGRVYLPQAWLDEAGARVAGPLPSEALYTVITRLLDEAEPYYKSGLAGLTGLPFREAWSIAAARRIYREIGQIILRDGPEAYTHRVRTTTPQKLILIARAFGDALASRHERGPARPEGLWTRPRAEAAR